MISSFAHNIRDGNLSANDIKQNLSRMFIIYQNHIMSNTYFGFM